MLECVPLKSNEKAPPDSFGISLPGDSLESGTNTCTAIRIKVDSWDLPETSGPSVGQKRTPSPPCHLPGAVSSRGPTRELSVRDSPVGKRVSESPECVCGTV